MTPSPGTGGVGLIRCAKTAPTCATDLTFRRPGAEPVPEIDHRKFAATLPNQAPIGNKCHTIRVTSAKIAR